MLGLTGSPGVGKSTTTTALVRALRAEGKRVGVLAVDPSSPFSGGALLGDRVRMQDHAGDSGVYIRSMASRGHLGGLSWATPQALRVLDAAGCDVVLVETVGVGQSELEIASLADTTLVLVAPGMGDGIQAAKAGILEVADVFVVNKADRDGADQTVRDLRYMQSLGGRHSEAGAGGRRSAGPSPPARPTTASTRCWRRSRSTAGGWSPPARATAARRAGGPRDRGDRARRAARADGRRPRLRRAGRARRAGGRRARPIPTAPPTSWSRASDGRPRPPPARMGGVNGKPDAVVVGAGPNGLAAALRLAAAGLRVQVVEAADRPGGGMRTEELIRPGFHHDVCSTVQPMAAAAPFFREFDLPEPRRPAGAPRGQLRPPAGRWPGRDQHAGPSRRPPRPSARTPAPTGGCSSRWSRTAQDVVDFFLTSALRRVPTRSPCRSRTSGSTACPTCAGWPTATSRPRGRGR